VRISNQINELINVGNVYRLFVARFRKREAS
jgi:hypothetical protein